MVKRFTLAVPQDDVLVVVINLSEGGRLEIAVGVW